MCECSIPSSAIIDCGPFFQHGNGNIKRSDICARFEMRSPSRRLGNFYPRDKCALRMTHPMKYVRTRRCAFPVAGVAFEGG